MESRFVLPKCPLPPHDEFHPVETFVANAIASRESEQDSTKEYRAILDCLRNRKDQPMLFKVLLALRTSGSTLYQLTSSSKTHAHLLHLLFRLDPFLPCEDKLQDTILDYSLADAHLHLILALVSANSVFLTPGMNALWRLAHQDLEDAPMERYVLVDCLVLLFFGDIVLSVSKSTARVEYMRRWQPCYVCAQRETQICFQC
jgi:RNA polymerase I-specific transcription initiation factor RRN3